MTKPQTKIALSASRDIPFDKLRLSQANVRHIKADVSIDQLAEDIARRTLLQSLTVRPVLDEAGQETGCYDVPAGGRRFRALELLVKQKRLSKTEPVPCVIRTEGIAEEDSLAENIQRAPLHPLDQFRAFLTLREKGQSEEEIAAAFFVTPALVRQRLRLASVSPKLLDVYADDGMTLDQLMAFTVSGDHERQEQVFERLARSYSKEGHTIRRMLTEGAVRACDKRARFVGVETYEAEGGTVMRDLFTPDDGGWLQDAHLVNLLAAKMLEISAGAVRAEGWKWTEVAFDFPYGHTFGLRQLRGEPTSLTPEEDTARAELQAEYDRIEEEHAQAEELPEDVDQRLGALEAELAPFEDRPTRFDPEEIAQAGAFVSIDPAGQLRVERGYVRPEDERAVASEPDPVELDVVEPLSSIEENNGSTPPDAGGVASPAYAEPEEEDDTIRPIPDRLMTDLTAFRTLALREALGDRPDVAFSAALHTLALQCFYSYGADSCLQITGQSTMFNAPAMGLSDSLPARSVDGRHKAWLPKMPKDPADLWDTIQGWTEEVRSLLFAHCVAQTLNAVHEGYNRRPRALAHADQLAGVLRLDMVKTGWTPTAENFLGRVTKGRIVKAVREARGDADADRIAGFKKDALVTEAEGLLAGSGWLPEPLRTPGFEPELAAAAPSNDVSDNAPEHTGCESNTTDAEEASGSAADTSVEPTVLAAE